ncbi:MAG: hypothetical protein K9J25_13220 [Bacteroidales bacterium]|nr:hypothetical protein [Bacteroidales bacterium]
MKKSLVFITFLAFLTTTMSGQGFEQKKIDGTSFDGLKVKLGADFAIQLQGLSHYADSALIPLGKNFTLPTANMNITADLAPGVRVSLTTYLSSRHHPETWVKGGYLIFDRLPFIKSEVVDRIMDVSTIRAGVMELNYGDAHFRRSDNGNIINNPFTGNYIMDAFTTAPALEYLYRNNGILAMAAVTTASLRPDLAGYSGYTGQYTAYNVGKELGFYGKVGYDKQLSEDFRIRATASGYHTGNHHFGSLYYGDRAGSRYYLVMNRTTGSSADVDISSGHNSGRWTPGFTDKVSSVMLNLFVRYSGLEFFGTYENASGTSAFGPQEFNFSQYAAEALYHFGNKDQFYAGARYNMVKNDQDMSVSRIQAGAGWHLTDNILVKGEYVNQEYTGFTDYGTSAGFKGVMIEAAVSF